MANNLELFNAHQLELFNAHQEDMRRRADSLCKALFVLSGGALTVSMGVFTRASAPMLSQNLSSVLVASWWALFLSIVLLAFTLTVIIARDYALGEMWRKKIAGESVDVSGKPTIIEFVIWAFAIAGLLGFIGGMLGLAYVATSLVSI